jgi:hypothetical protein
MQKFKQAALGQHPNFNERISMGWEDQLNGGSLTWLLEPDNPGVRYLAVRDLLDLSAQDQELLAAQQIAHQAGPISIILNAMNASGYWVEPGPGYNPKYRSTVWAVILLGQLGAKIEMDNRIVQACNYLLENALTEKGQFPSTGTPSGTADCLQGNLCTAMLELGFDDPRLDQALEWMARSVTGDGVAPLEGKQTPLRCYAGKCGPVFAAGQTINSPVPGVL